MEALHYYIVCFITGGLFGTQPASEFCLTLSNANVSASIDLDAKYISVLVRIHYKICCHMHACLRN